MPRVSKTRMRKMFSELRKRGCHELSFKKALPSLPLEKGPKDLLDKTVSGQVCVELAYTGLGRIEVDHLMEISALFELVKHVHSMWSCPVRPLGVCG